jgi:hypothetical protein
MHPSRATFVACLAGVAGLVLVPAAWANFAPRYWGDATGEPWGLKSVAITRERLTIDLRRLTDANVVGVEVTYDLSNAGPPRHLDLLFISGEVGIRDFQAHLGEEPLFTRLLPRDEAERLWEHAPRSWRPPEKGLGIEHDDTYYTFGGESSSQEMVAVAVELPSGPSKFHVRYRTRACGTNERPTITWQLPYVLAPAREWGAFGGLEVTVYVPGGWEARSAPALEREGDILRGSFTELPADALQMATGPPVPRAYHWVAPLPLVLWGALLVIGSLMCVLAGRRLGRARASAKASGGEGPGCPSWLGLGLFPALLWGALIYASVPVSMGIVRASLHGQESPGFRDPWFAGPCLNFIIIPAAVLFGVTLSLASASVAGTPPTIRRPREP